MLPCDSTYLHIIYISVLILTSVFNPCRKNGRKISTSHQYAMVELFAEEGARQIFCVVTAGKVEAENFKIADMLYRLLPVLLLEWFYKMTGNNTGDDAMPMHSLVEREKKKVVNWLHQWGLAICYFSIFFFKFKKCGWGYSSYLGLPPSWCVEEDEIKCGESLDRVSCVAW